MKKNLSLFMIMFTLLGWRHTPLTSQEAVIYHYGYITQEAKTRLTGESPSLVLIDPDVGVVDTISIPTKMLVVEALPSPNGEWIALVPQATPFDESLVLYHIPSEQMRVLSVSMGLSRDSSRGILGESAIVAWSPNSDYLAYVSVQNGQQDVFVYSIVNGENYNITNNVNGHASLVWETNYRLAFASEDCKSAGCDVSIKIYDIETMTEQVSVAVPFANPLSFGKGLCNLKFSPDKSLASFSRTCASEAISSIAEVYITDLTTMQVTALTNFTENEVPVPNAPASFGGWRFGVYDMYWYDNQTLLVGVSTAFQQSGMTQEYTYHYDLQNFGISDELLQTMAQHWSPNLLSGDLAFLSISGFLDITSAQTQLATWDGTQLTITASYPPGCNLRWSPDYRYLAYIRHEMPFSGCGNRTTDINGVYFLDTDQNTLIEHNIEATGFIVPVGWVRAVRE